MQPKGMATEVSSATLHGSVEARGPLSKYATAYSRVFCRRLCRAAGLSNLSPTSRICNRFKKHHVCFHSCRRVDEVSGNVTNRKATGVWISSKGGLRRKAMCRQSDRRRLDNPMQPMPLLQLRPVSNVHFGHGLRHDRGDREQKLRIHDAKQMSPRTSRREAAQCTLATVCTTLP